MGPWRSTRYSETTVWGNGDYGICVVHTIGPYHVVTSSHLDSHMKGRRAQKSTNQRMIEVGRGWGVGDTGG